MAGSGAGPAAGAWWEQGLGLGLGALAEAGSWGWECVVR